MKFRIIIVLIRIILVGGLCLMGTNTFYCACLYTRPTQQRNWFESPVLTSRCSGLRFQNRTGPQSQVLAQVFWSIGRRYAFMNDGVTLIADTGRHVKSRLEQQIKIRQLTARAGNTVLARFLTVSA
ncbi:hypothetical protein C8R44DRAFT_111625 [Mycena epipterygia]|nr:hypothetical protein C8R44DRAFT_111625 [Mycena epipterygia]